jgi:hypothetical protein
MHDTCVHYYCLYTSVSYPRDNCNEFFSSCSERDVDKQACGDFSGYVRSVRLIDPHVNTGHLFLGRVLWRAYKEKWDLESARCQCLILDIIRKRRKSIVSISYKWNEQSSVCQVHTN